MNSEKIEYILASCSGKITQSGRYASGFILESLDGTVQLSCPTFIECNEVPNSKHEIATPSVARHYRHLQGKEQYIPEYDRDTDIFLLFICF